MPISERSGVLALISGEGAKVQQMPSDQARTLTQIQRLAV